MTHTIDVKPVLMTRNATPNAKTTIRAMVEAPRCWLCAVCYRTWGLGFSAGGGDAIESDLITNSNGESDSIADLLLSTFSLVGAGSMISVVVSGVCSKALSASAHVAFDRLSPETSIPLAWAIALSSLIDSSE
jgi:hypothetical protein